MKKLTLKEMTESEQRDVKTQLDKARINLGRALTNSEQNKVKDEAIEKIMNAREQIAKLTRVERKPKKQHQAQPPLAGQPLSAHVHHGNNSSTDRK